MAEWQERPPLELFDSEFHRFTAVDSGLIPSRVKPMTLKLVFSFPA